MENAEETEDRHCCDQDHEKQWSDRLQQAATPSRRFQYETS
jgi:hypothetical protein